MSAAAKLYAFLLLLAMVFAGAYAAGAHLGPVSATNAPPGSGTPMNMSSPTPPGSSSPAGTRP